MSETSWNSKANAIWIDQPPGTGFSNGTPDTNEDEVGEDMYAFLQNLIATFPDYFKNGFYIFGESVCIPFLFSVSYHECFEFLWYFKCFVFFLNFDSCTFFFFFFSIFVQSFFIFYFSRVLESNTIWHAYLFFYPVLIIPCVFVMSDENNKQ